MPLVSPRHPRQTVVPKRQYRLSAHADSAGIWRGTLRVTFWEALAMAITYGIGSLFGTTIA